MLPSSLRFIDLRLRCYSRRKGNKGHGQVSRTEIEEDLRPSVIMARPLSSFTPAQSNDPHVGVGGVGSGTRPSGPKVILADATGVVVKIITGLGGGGEKPRRTGCSLSQTEQHSTECVPARDTMELQLSGARTIGASFRHQGLLKLDSAACRRHWHPTAANYDHAQLSPSPNRLLLHGPSYQRGAHEEEHAAKRSWMGGGGTSGAWIYLALELCNMTGRSLARPKKS